MPRHKLPGDYGKVTVMKIEVTKNSLLKVPVEVPQWEAQVVLALWGEDAQPIGEANVVERRLPASVEDEYQRLVDKYGPRDADVPVVAQVYGSFGPGLRALQNEINISIQGGWSKDKPAAEEAKPEQEVSEPVLTDEQVEAMATAAPTFGVTDDQGEVKFADLV